MPPLILLDLYILECGTFYFIKGEEIKEDLLDSIKMQCYQPEGDAPLVFVLFVVFIPEDEKWDHLVFFFLKL